MTDPLEKLVVSGEDLNKELLATVLVDLVRVERDTGEVRFTTRAAKLPKNQQILVFLLGRKAAKALGLIKEEAISPGAMEPKTGMKGGPLRGQLSVLKKSRLVQSDRGKYFVPNYAIEPVKQIITGQKEGS